jgi:predicted Zn-dependent peptidase
LTLVHARSTDADRDAFGLSLSVAIGEGRESFATAPMVMARVSAPEPRCDRAGISARVIAEPAFADFVSRGPASALDVALWREATRLNALSSDVDPAVRSAHGRAFDPRNVVLAVVSSSEPAALDAAVDRTVGVIPSRQTQPLALRERAASSDGWSVSDDRGQPQWSRQWTVVGDRRPDHYAIELLAYALHDARFGPLARTLNDRAVRGVVLSDAYVEHRTDRDSLRWTLRYAAARGARPALDQLADETLARLGREGILGSELRAARERWRLDWQTAQSSVDALALRLARFESRWGNARLALTEQDRFDSVTVQDVLRVLHERIVRTPSAAPEAR